LTDNLETAALQIIEEVEKLGGMASAVNSGMPKLRIEESAARRQAMIDSGAEVIVGVNKYRLKDEEPIEVLAIDNSAVRKKQIALLDKIKASRNEQNVQSALQALTDAAANKSGNLLELSITAARARCTVGEISDALETVYGRYQPSDRMVRSIVVLLFLPVAVASR
jgi:methylmalonyl-CoA mutase